MSTKPGPLAHLVERFHGMEEVRGSIPLGSTITKHSQLFAEIFCNEGVLGRGIEKLLS